MDDWMLLGLFVKAIGLLILLSLGPLLVGMVVGVLIGVLQAATSIQEATLSFLPKLMAVLVLMIVLGPLMARLLVTFTTSLYTMIPQVAH